MNEQTKNTDYETRVNALECRAVLGGGGDKFIEGYALLYNHKSRLLFDWGGPFYEEIQPGALDEILSRDNLDVIATPNHNYDQVLGRTKSGTLKLENDERGLKYSVKIPNTSFGNDIYESIQRGDTFESSFTFMIDSDGQRWLKDKEGADLRIISKIKELREVSPVTWGAYSNTEVAARALQANGQHIDPETVEQPVQPTGAPLINFILKLKTLKK